MTKGIYSIKNSVNNKQYIGMSVNIENRLSVHRSLLINNKHPNIHLQRAWNKFGESSFTFEIVEAVSTDDGELLAEKEKAYIALCDSFKNGYNRSLGGDGTSSFMMDEERLAKMSAAMLGNKYSLGHKHSEESIERRVAAWRAAVNMEEHAERMRQRAKKQWKDSSFREMQKALHTGNQWGKGRKLSKEHIEKLRQRRGGKNPFYGKQHGKETLEKLREISLSRWMDEDFREMMSLIKQEYMKSPAYREKMSNATKGARNPRAKLSEKQAIEIKLLYLAGEKLRDIHRAYEQHGLSKRAVQKVCLGETWKHLPSDSKSLNHMLINYHS